MASFKCCLFVCLFVCFSFGLLVFGRDKCSMILKRFLVGAALKFLTRYTLYVLRLTVFLRKVLTSHSKEKNMKRRYVDS